MKTKKQLEEIIGDYTYYNIVDSLRLKQFDLLDQDKIQQNIINRKIAIAVLSWVIDDHKSLHIESSE